MSERGKGKKNWGAWEETARRIKDEVSPCKGSTIIFALWKQKNGEGNQRVGEGEGGQTHWLAEEERSGKRDDEENTRKSDSWPCPT